MTTATAQGIYKRLAYKKQTGLGAAAGGSGGQYLRRETATFSKKKAAFNSNEITTHQQYTGDTYGVSNTDGTITGDLSPKTYSDLLASLCRGAFVAGATTTGASLTIAGTGPTFTITRAAGSFLTDGFKAGDVARITAGAFTGVALNLNLLVTAVTALALTVIVPNGKTLAAQGPIASATISVVNKKVVVPDTGQVNDYYSFEEWFSDITRSRLWTDTQIATAEIQVPANANAKATIGCLGLGRTEGPAQVLTAPSLETTTTILNGSHAAILINGTQYAVGTSFTCKIDSGDQTGEPVIGANTIADIIKGDIKVSGTVTLLKQDESVSSLFENETPVQIIAVLFADATDQADFIGFSIPRAKIFTDDVDDGKKQLISTHNFTAEHNIAGGAALATDTGIISIQDSAA